MSDNLLEDNVRRDVVLDLISTDRGTPAEKIIEKADLLVDYIMQGKKKNSDLVKKTKIFLPPAKTVDANAYLLDDGSVLIEASDPEVMKRIFDNLDEYGFSFSIIDRPVETPKDN